MSKISEIYVASPKGAAMQSDDLLVISDYNGVTYDTKAVTGKEIRLCKEYICRLNQSGISAPTNTGFESNLSGTITLARTSAGTYTFTNSVSEFTANKTFVFVTNGGGGIGVYYQVAYVSTTVITLYTWNSSGSLADGLLNDASFNIKVIN